MLYFGLGLSQNAVLGSDVIGREGGGNGMLIHNYLVLFRMVVMFFFAKLSPNPSSNPTDGLKVGINPNSSSSRPTIIVLLSHIKA